MSNDAIKAALAHLPEIIPGTPEVRCGTCRFRRPQYGILADAGMGTCGRYRGRVSFLTLGHSEACWHHQRRKAARDA